jgi:hypothetical protein
VKFHQQKYPQFGVEKSNKQYIACNQTLDTYNWKWKTTKILTVLCDLNVDVITKLMCNQIFNIFGESKNQKNNF